jgi:hypothetical protein
VPAIALSSHSAQFGSLAMHIFDHASSLTKGEGSGDLARLVWIWNGQQEASVVLGVNLGVIDV